MRLGLRSAEAGTTRFGRMAMPVAVSRRRLDPVELAALTLFALLSLWIVVLDVAHAGTGRVWTGTDGIYLVDQMQYLAWIRGVSQHGLAANMFVLRHTPADYFQPAVMISGGLVALGMAPWLALLLWKPVAVFVTFLAFRAFIHKATPAPFARRIALVLAIFYGSFSIVYGSWSVVGDLMPTFLSWGYAFGLLAVGLLVLALLAYDRARDDARTRYAPGLLGAGAALVHPWQAELLIMIVLVGELVMWRRGATELRRLLRTPLITVALTGLPLVYYLVLGRLDLSWHQAREASKHAFSLWTILLALAPLAVPALLAARPRRITFLAVIIRVWPLAAVAVWLLSGSAVSATPLHAFEGITLPLSLLAVEGVGRMWPRPLPRSRRTSASPGRRARVAAVIVTALITVPATVYLLHHVRYLVSPWSGNANFITASERDALHYLANAPASGGVLTRFYLGAIVPAETGRRSFVGDCLWSQPHCTERAQAVQALLDGTMPAEQARAFVHDTGARFVLADCQVTGSLRAVLAPSLASVRRFGCATVYELHVTAPPAGPLAESGRYAALRPSWG